MSFSPFPRFRSQKFTLSRGLSDVLICGLVRLFIPEPTGLVIKERGFRGSGWGTAKS